MFQARVKKIILSSVTTLTLASLLNAAVLTQPAQATLSITWGVPSMFIMGVLFAGAGTTGVVMSAGSNQGSKSPLGFYGAGIWMGILLLDEKGTPSGFSMPSQDVMKAAGVTSEESIAYQQQLEAFNEDLLNSDLNESNASSERIQAFLENYPPEFVSALKKLIIFGSSK